MRIKNLTKLVLATAVSASFAAQAQATRDTIQVAGSSTVLPFSSIAAEEFGNSFAQFKTPVVGSGGTGGGLRQFCQGVGTNTIDVANASRAIRPAELDSCKANGVNEVIEVKIGFDGIVFASRIDACTFALEPVHVFLAQAAQVPQNGQMVANPYTRWSQIDKSLPDQAILLAIPGSNHGTREVYEEKVILDGCKTLPEVKAMPSADQNNFCLAMRTDGRVVEIAGDYTETLARLRTSPSAVVVFGLGFYDQNRDKLRVATVNNVAPSEQTILNGSYPVSRPLFFYVKGEHLKSIKGLQQYTEFFLSKKVSGKGSKLEKAGLISLSDKERAQILANFKAGKAVK